jgi:FkbM family methyltransferase
VSTAATERAGLKGAAIRSRIVNFVRFVRDRRHYMSLAAEAAALRARVAVLNADLQEARRALDAPSPREADYSERRSLVLVPRILELLDDRDKFHIVDAGAREVDRDPRWRPFPPDRLSFIGFEADKQEAGRLNAEASAAGLSRHFVAAGLWSATGTKEFQHNNLGGGSSFLSLKQKVTDRWKFENPMEARNARDIFFPVKTERIGVVSLSDWAAGADIGKIDFMKLNVQGAEKEILTGAGPLLSDILGILVEVGFVESYQGRPMFADVDVMLREHGFSFFDLLAHHYVGRAESPINAQHLRVSKANLGQLVSSWGQLVEGHALYLRDPIAEDRAIGFQRTLKLAALAEAFGQVEFAFELLNWLAKQSEAADPPKAEKVRTLVAAAALEYAEFLRPGLSSPVDSNGNR